MRVHSETATQTDTDTLTVIGCGNANRSDDAVGVHIARRLSRYLDEFPNPRVRVFDAGTAGMEVMFQARGSRHLIVIDACRSGAAPGEIFELPAAELMDLAPPRRGFNLHDFRWDHALYAGQRIFADDFPATVRVYLIEAADVSFGFELSEPVQRAADLVFTGMCRTVRGYGGD
jgi:hydrogenase maturation protease